MLVNITPEDLEDTLDTIESLLTPQSLPLGESADSLRRRVREAIRHVVSALAGEHPLIVIIEDLHWADSSSFDCITSLANDPEATSAPLFWLLTTRPDDTGAVDEIFADGAISQIHLDELDTNDRRQLISDCLGETKSKEDLIHEIERRAGGNPFYVHELAEAARELDVTAFAAIPDTVRGVLGSRIDHLPPRVKIVVQHAAVIGPVFREAILTRLLSQNPARSLAELRNRGILVPGVSMAVPFSTGTSEQFEREWAFGHVLVQEVIYEAISSAARRELHLKVGQIMSQRASRGSTDPPAEVARHLELAGERDEARSYYLRAAENAAASYANKGKHCETHKWCHRRKFSPL